MNNCKLGNCKNLKKLIKLNNQFSCISPAPTATGLFSINTGPSPMWRLIEGAFNGSGVYKTFKIKLEFRITDA